MKQESNITPEMQALLDQLHNIVVPADVSMWPPAFAWWVLAALLLALLVLGLITFLQRRRIALYRREAHAELDHFPDLPAPALAQKVSALLKRAALTAYPDDRHRIAGLFGADWVWFLNHTCRKPIFSEDSAKILAGDCYRAEPTIDAARLKQQAAQWVKHHRHSLDASAFPPASNEGVAHDRV